METSGIGNSADREIGFREILFRRRVAEFHRIKNEHISPLPLFVWDFFPREN